MYRPNDILSLITATPFWLSILALVKIYYSNGLHVDWLMIVPITFFDETIFRYLFFLIFPRTVMYCFLSATLYASYGYSFVPKMISLIVYGSLGFMFALSSRKYSLFTLFFFRLIINVSVFSR